MSVEQWAKVVEQSRLPDRVVVPRKIERRRRYFVMVPWMWIERLVDARHIATYRVALHVLYQDWKGGSKPFTLSNSAVMGVSRWQKWRALRELERLGLVTIERRKRKAPLITAIPAAAASKKS
jgi:hypothetical protein